MKWTLRFYWGRIGIQVYIYIMPTLGLKVVKDYLHCFFWIPRDGFGLNPPDRFNPKYSSFVYLRSQHGSRFSHAQKL